MNELVKNEEKKLKPKDLVKDWIKKFNKADIEGLASLYAEDCVNDQVVFSQPLRGRKAVKEMFKLEFSRAEMVCIEENIFESGDWAILQWKDPLGLRGCGFFKVLNDQIVEQKGYFDQLTFFKIQKLPIPKDYLGEI